MTDLVLFCIVILVFLGVISLSSFIAFVIIPSSLSILSIPIIGGPLFVIYVVFRHGNIF
ncbi:MAG: hypothetical protein QXL94_06030 [Candidatus Parvarchaeum sp.]